VNVQKSFDEWVNNRDGLEDHELCPCDNHPAHECVTCRGACGCHYTEEGVTHLKELVEDVVIATPIGERPSEAPIVYDLSNEDE
jgi:hypothetical protein